MTKTYSIQQVNGKLFASVKTQSELSALVEEYLADLGEAGRARNETYTETAERLGGDKFMEAAECRWFELES